MNKFFKKVNKDGPIPAHAPELGSCWEWISHKNKWGYGATSRNKKGVYAHRLSWILHNGDIPDDQIICHLCDNPACVRLSHLLLATHKFNVADMNRKGRAWKHGLEINAKKTHCPRGHEYSPVNTCLNSRGQRDCRACRREFGRGPRPKLAKEK